jgi:hypothetical protein
MHAALFPSIVDSNSTIEEGLMLPSERFKGIDAFVAAADLGSFTAAANRLNLTTSAISKSVGGWKPGSAAACSSARHAGWR